jgi:hypothetical protein
MQRAFVFDHRRLRSVEVVSPWTGNVIPLENFVDACFVWYGLWRFWSLDIAKDALEKERAQSLEELSRSGFLGDSPMVERLADFKSAVSPELLESISRMQEEVKAGVVSLD